MRRIAAALVIVVAVSALAALSIGASSPTGTNYGVRAVFDNASFLTPGEDVKISGVKVGKIKQLDVTDDKRAAITLDISNTGFAPFHQDAHCSIRPESLIGERYVECTPGSARTAALAKIPAGQPGAGEHLLENTSSPVDVDLVNSVMRLPFRQRLAIIVNEFGTALAGRGGALNQAIHRANPALRQTDKVLNILAQQNKVLASLAADSDAVIAPLAEKRKRVSHFVVASNETARATAERSADIERSFQLLPTFLSELRPTLRDLGDVSDQMTPVLADLDRSAPDLNRFISTLGPFSAAATPALVTLGKATEIGRPALIRSRPLIQKVAKLAKNAGPVGKNLDAVTASLDKTGGLERLLDYLFFQMTAINGFDGVSHYLRAALLTNLCSTYAVDPTIGCNANYTATQSVGSSGYGSSKNGQVLARTKEALSADQAPDPPAGAGSGNAPRTTNPFDALRELTDPAITRARNQSLHNASGAGRTESPMFGPKTPQEQALDYLLGSESK
jgi:phospholipid/cholesterol/gamma-HCH transport system substrate-binding protein